MGNNRTSAIRQGEVIVTSVPSAAKTKAEGLLMGALLREPYSLPNVMGLLNRVALSNASDDLAAAFLAILDQFQAGVKYSATSIEAKTGRSIAHFAATDTDIDLEWAVDHWRETYGIWAEATALMQGVSENKMAEGQMKMREAVDEWRVKLGANGEVVNGNGAEDFLTWGVDKLAGREIIHKTTPSVEALRSIIGAYKPKSLWIVGGRPGMGKTQFMLNEVSHFHDCGAKGLLFSLEMGAEDLYRRLLGIRHGINHDADWSGLDGELTGRALSETASVKDSVTVIDNVFSISGIEAAAISAFYKGNLDYIVVDFLQLVMAAGKHTNRDSEIGSIADALQRLSMRLNVPLIALSQLSREVEKRTDKRPNMGDLRESGRIEQSAYGIIFPYRPEYYKIYENENGADIRGTGELIVAKHKNGRIGTAIAKSNEIRGYTNLRPAASQFPTTPPFQPAVPISARPNLDTPPF